MAGPHSNYRAKQASAKPAHRPERPRLARSQPLLRLLSIAGVVAIVIAASIAPIAQAAEVITEDDPIISQSETFNEDVYIFADRAAFNGRATRDVIAAVRRFELGQTGRITGNLNVAAQEVIIRGSIGRSMRVAAQDVVVSGLVDGDLLVTASSVEIQAGAEISGDLILAVSNAEVLGTVRGDVRGNASTLTLEGATVDGDVGVDVGELALEGDTRVAGDLSYGSDNAADIAAAAAVQGEIVQDESSGFAGDTVGIDNDLALGLFRILTGLVAGLVVVLVMPRGAASVADGVRRRAPIAFVTGLVLLILIPVLAVILMATVVGLPIGMIALAFYGAVLYLSQVFVGLAIGRWILPNSWGDVGRGYNLLAMTIGVLILGGLRLIPVPFIDPAIAALTAILGLGALIIRAPRPVAMAPPAYPAYPNYPPPGYGQQQYR